MRLPSRVSGAAALIVRIAVSIAALVSFGAGLVAYVNGRVPAGENLPLAGTLLVLAAAITDRKSTRLNSSHSQISYAVFCLKKKKSQPGPARFPLTRPLYGS